MAIPDGYRLLTSSDVGKTFGVDLELEVYFDTNSDFSYVSEDDTYRFISFSDDSYIYVFTWTSPTGVVYPGVDYNSDTNFSSIYSAKHGGWFIDSLTLTENIEITSFNTDVDWNNWLYVKDIQTATPKEEFISNMNSLGKSITDKAGASGKKSITELKDLVDNLKTTFTGQEKTVTPSKTSQVITPDSGYDGLSKVTVDVIPSSYIIPSGTLAISENGTQDVTQYASVEVNIEPTYWDGTYEESDVVSGYTLTLNCDSRVLNNSTLYSYSLDSGTTWNQFTSETMTLENVENIMFQSNALQYFLYVGTTPSAYDIAELNIATSNDITITEDTTWYVSLDR